jgi:hypothetical protein
MAASVILLVDADVGNNSPAALTLSRHHPFRLAILDYKVQGTDGAEFYGHLNRVHADTVGVLVTAFAAATVHAASRRRPAGPCRAGGAGRLIPLIEEFAGTP